MKWTTLFFLFFSVFAWADDIDFGAICEAYEDPKEPISPQHRYVKRLGVLSCRMHYRVYQMPWMYWNDEGKRALALADLHRQRILELLECTNFTYDNTREDRVFACTEEMNGAYRATFALSDHLEYIKKTILQDTYNVLIHNRRGLDIIMGQTQYKRPRRSWYDFGQDI